MASPILTDSDLSRLKQAVAEAETQTAGEIVPYVIRQSDDYGVAVWRGGAVGALAAAAALLVVGMVSGGWDQAWLYTSWMMALTIAAGGLLGAVLVGAWPAARRLFTGHAEMERQVRKRAYEAFLEEEVFDTRDRTGILLYVSLLEHRIEVMGDVGINAKVEPEDWEGVVGLIRDGIREDSLADGLERAIRRCGELLHRKGVEIRPDDTDELSDRVRLRDE